MKKWMITIIAGMMFFMFFGGPVTAIGDDFKSENNLYLAMDYPDDTYDSDTDAYNREYNRLLKEDEDDAVTDETPNPGNNTGEQTSQQETKENQEGN